MSAKQSEDNVVKLCQGLLDIIDNAKIKMICSQVGNEVSWGVRGECEARFEKRTKTRGWTKDQA